MKMVTTMRPESSFWMAVNSPYIGKKTMTSQFISMTPSPNNFDVDLFLLSSLVAGLSFMSVSWLVLQLWQFLFYKSLTRNPKMGNTPVWVLPNILRLGKVRDTKFGTNVSNKTLLYIAKCQCYRFYCFEVIKEKTTGKKVKLMPPLPPLLPLLD